VSCDEVTTINNQSWIFIHVYVVEGCLITSYEFPVAFPHQEIHNPKFPHMEIVLV